MDRDRRNEQEAWRRAQTPPMAQAPPRTAQAPPDDAAIDRSSMATVAAVPTIAVTSHGYGYRGYPAMPPTAVRPGEPGAHANVPPAYNLMPLPVATAGSPLGGVSAVVGQPPGPGTRYEAPPAEAEAPKRKKTIKDRLFGRSPTSASAPNGSGSAANLATPPMPVLTEELARTPTQRSKRRADESKPRDMWAAMVDDDSMVEFGRTDTNRFVRLKHWLQRYPTWVLWLCAAIVGDLVFMFFGMMDWMITVLVYDPAMRYASIQTFQSAQMSIDYCSTFSMMVVASISWTISCFLHWFLLVLPGVLLRVLSFVFGTTTRRMELWIDYLQYLRTYLHEFLAFLVAYVTWISVFSIQVNQNGSGFGLTIGRLLLSATLIWAVVAIEKLLIQMFAISFHQMAYSDRIRRTKNAMYVIDRLNEVRLQLTESPSNTRNPSAMPSPILAEDDGDSDTDCDTPSVVLERERDGMPSAEGSASSLLQDSGAGDSADATATNTTPAPDGSESTLRAASRARVGMSGAAWSNMMSDFGQRAARALDKTTNILVKTAVEATDRTVNLLSSRDARRYAGKIFDALDTERAGALTKEQFRQFFETEREGDIAFGIFDRDGNGDVSRSEMKAAFVTIYRERQSLGKSLRDSSQAISKLDKIFKAIASIVLLFVLLSVFKVDYASFLAAAISLWLGTLFAIGPTVKNLLEAIIFLFVTHPFDVGDRIEVGTDPKTYVVKEFGIMTTTLRRTDGIEVYAPNAQLATQMIRNIRRSGHAWETFVIPVSIHTSAAQLDRLTSLLNDWLAKQSREFAPKTSVTVDGITGRDRMNVSFAIEFKSNMQDGARHGARRVALVQHIRQAVLDAGLAMASEQDITIHSGRGGDSQLERVLDEAYRPPGSGVGASSAFKAGGYSGGPIKR